MRALLALSFSLLFLSSCSNSPSGPGNMGTQPSPEIRKEQIANEARGDFYYGRRYYVRKTRFWGYLREPGKPAHTGKLVIFNESRKHNPDRLPEAGPGKNYGFDNNYEYKIYGRYTGRTLYEPNSNQFLPEFQLSDYQVVSTNPGWLFTPSDNYNPARVTLLPRR
ncbi:hypothetical protein V2O64_01870 [Verrucomicrobiaceae bacterium 227]